MCKTWHEKLCSIYYAKCGSAMETIIDTQSNSSRDYKCWIIVTILLREIKSCKKYF